MPLQEGGKFQGPVYGRPRAESWGNDPLEAHSGTAATLDRSRPGHAGLPGKPGHPAFLETAIDDLARDGRPAFSKWGQLRYEYQRRQKVPPALLRSHRLTIDSRPVSTGVGTPCICDRNTLFGARITSLVQGCEPTTPDPRVPGSFPNTKLFLSHLTYSLLATF